MSNIIIKLFKIGLLIASIWAGVLICTIGTVYVLQELIKDTDSSLTFPN